MFTEIAAVRSVDTGEKKIHEENSKSQSFKNKIYTYVYAYAYTIVDTY